MKKHFLSPDTNFFLTNIKFKKISEISMHQNFLNALWEFTGGKEDKDNFTPKHLKCARSLK